MYAQTEIFDGTSWTEVGDVATGRYATFSAGTAAAGIISAGLPGNPAITEEWTKANVVTTLGAS